MTRTPRGRKSPTGISAQWLAEFDGTLRRYNGVDHTVLVLEREDLRRYASLPGREAALLYAEEYDLGLLSWWEW